jgi:hypothetical protein
MNSGAPEGYTVLASYKTLAVLLIPRGLVGSVLLPIYIPRRVSYKKQELLTLQELLASSQGFDGIRVVTMRCFILVGFIIKTSFSMYLHRNLQWETRIPSIPRDEPRDSWRVNNSCFLYDTRRVSYICNNTDPQTLLSVKTIRTSLLVCNTEVYLVIF